MALAQAKPSPNSSAASNPKWRSIFTEPAGLHAGQRIRLSEHLTGAISLPASLRLSRRPCLQFGEPCFMAPLLHVIIQKSVFFAALQQFLLNGDFHWLFHSANF
jgi:hypothetical protein